MGREEFGLGWLMSSDLDVGIKGLYLIAPILLVICQYANIQINKMSTEENIVTRGLSFLPFISGLAAASSPAGIGIYWLTNSSFSLL
jgi:membrane protein insertase Oxa1/YidC/SpoIIIJ